ncbi:AAA family ATPase [Floridanema aerugineum]|jgi:predicted ATPase|uniref:AAA family ATPase n=1 Tax=Floridaenema aerugineum BLCC-F46 TaxID=3153654 RepID=A0ABV4X0I5_9CYAN
MKIKELTYYDHELEWRFNPIHFSDLTLLVGVSGVGKTQILRSIIALRKIAKGGSLNGVEWDVSFLNTNNLSCRWKGKFETQKETQFIIEDEQTEKSKFRISEEYLWTDETLIVERNYNETKFKNNPVPKLSPSQSVVQIFSEEEDIAPIQDAFNHIVYTDHDQRITNSIFLNYTAFRRKYDCLEKIQQSNIPVQIKLALVYHYVPDTFQKIKNNFIEIFPQVEDIQIKPIEGEDLPSFLADNPIVYIKEIGVNDWIAQNRISSGMFRTLMHISELYLCADGSVILIDEFENSLGVNCIDVLTELLLENRNLQFIITSHHPYIINKISMEHWKIVTRQGGVVTARDAKDFNLGKSRHQAFMQLINLEEYAEGIKV